MEEGIDDRLIIHDVEARRPRPKPLTTAPPPLGWKPKQDEKSFSKGLDNKPQDDVELVQRLKDIKWPVDYGSVEVEIQKGKPTLVTIKDRIKVV